MTYSAVWYPADTSRKMPLVGEESLSADDFRVMFKRSIQRMVMRIFFDEIRSVTGPGSLKEVLSRLNVDVKNDSELRVWYSRSRGERFPRPQATKTLRAGIPKVMFDPHHPVLKWLAVPNINERTVRRLQSQMSHLVRQLIAQVLALPVEDLNVSPQLFGRLRLEKLSYLDTLFAIARARHSKCCCVVRKKALNRILWALPILYPDDPMWSMGTRDNKLELMSFIDYALGLYGPDFSDTAWNGSCRVSLIASQKWNFERYMDAHPEGLRTLVLRRRYWARIWRWR